MNHKILEKTVLPGNHCYFASINNLINDHQITITETGIYFIANGLNVGYKSGFSFEWETYNEQVLLAVEKKYNLKCHYMFDVKEKGFYNDMLIPLSKQNKVLLFIQSKYLDYHQINLENPNRSHAIVLSQINLNEQVGYVSDSISIDYGGNILTYQGGLAIENIRKGTWGWAWFDWCDFRPMTQKEVMEEGIINIKNFIANQKSKNGIDYGLQAYRKFFENFTNLSTLDKEALNKTCHEIYYKLRVGTIITLMDYLEKFIHMAAKHYEKDCSTILFELSNLRIKWQNNMFSICKMGIRNNKKQIEGVKNKSLQLIDCLNVELEEFVLMMET